MKQLTKNIIIITLVTFTGLFVNAQSGIYIPQGANVFFASDSATAFSSVQNNGNLGIAQEAVVNFEGKTWTNGSKAAITGEGTVRFSGSEAQQIDAAYNAVTRTGASFSTLEIANKAGVELIGSNAKVSNELKLTEGLVTLNENILVVGNNNAGKISGYDASSYIVSDKKEGYLLRENISKNDGLVVFPVGTLKGFTPATIRMHSEAADNFYVNVMDGANAETSISVNRTWNIGKQFRPGQDSVEVVLEHLVKEEGRIYSQNRNKAFVAQYLNNEWKKANGTIATVSSFTKLVVKKALVNGNPSGNVTTPEASYKLNVWPNPTTGKFNVSINGDIKVENLVVWNIVGALMAKKAVNGANLVEMEQLIPGTYVIGFISPLGHIVETRKLVVAGF